MGYYRQMINIFKGVFKSYYSSPQRYYYRGATLAVAAAAAAHSLYRVEKIPFSERKHLVYPWRGCRFPSRIDTYIIEEKGRPLPPTHPKTIRAATMVREIAQAMHNILGLDKDSIVRAYAPRDSSAYSHKPTYFTQQVWPVGKWRSFIDFGSSKNMESIRNRRFEYGTKHLEGREWRVVVTDTPEVNASILGLEASTIVVYEGMLDFCSDSELAFVMGHEMGHAIGRHSCEKFVWDPIDVMMLVLLIIMLLIWSFVAPQYVLTTPEMLRNLMFSLGSLSISQSLELEADFIGMILMAAAGYDPRAATSYYLKSDEPNYSYDYFSTHPSTYRSLKSLNTPERMKKAMDLYKEVKASRERLNTPRRIMFNDKLRQLLSS